MRHVNCNVQLYVFVSFLYANEFILSLKQNNLSCKTGECELFIGDNSFKVAFKKKKKKKINLSDKETDTQSI